MLALELRDGVNTGSWPTQLRYVQAGRLSEAVSELQCGASPNAWTPGGDVFSGVAYPNWDIDLFAQHFVLSPTLKTKLRGWAADKSYYCECCMVVEASWCHLKLHVLGKNTNNGWRALPRQLSLRPQRQLRHCSSRTTMPSGSIVENLACRRC